MDKELIDIAWRCLPRDFREEVKKEWKKTDNNTAKWTIEYFFSKHNLTPGAEGEGEVLYVSRKKVQELYDLVYEIYADGTKEWYQGYMKAMYDLFGSKCLPDEWQFAKSANCLDPKPAEPKFKVGDKVRLKDVYEIEEIDEDQAMVGLKACAYMEDIDNLEHYTEQKEEADKHFDDIISRDFADHNRLHIAAMLAAGMLANEVRCYPVDRALELADQLIAACEKGGQDA